MNLDSLFNDMLKEINDGISSKITCDKIAAYCKENSIDNKSVNFLQEHIYIDDIQKEVQKFWIYSKLYLHGHINFI